MFGDDIGVEIGHEIVNCVDRWVLSVEGGDKLHGVGKVICKKRDKSVIEER
jgi:hypothetical protein